MLRSHESVDSRLNQRTGHALNLPNALPCVIPPAIKTGTMPLSLVPMVYWRKANDQLHIHNKYRHRCGVESDDLGPLITPKSQNLGFRRR